MKSRILTAVLLAAISAVTVSASSAGPVDSTGVHQNVMSTLVIPTGVTTNDVLNINCQINGGTVVAGGGCTYMGTPNGANPGSQGSTTIPPGYTEISVPMGPHSIGDGSGVYGTAYYSGLGYTMVQVQTGNANGWPRNPCNSDLSPRVLFSPGIAPGGGDGSSGNATPASFWVCEPSGTRTTLQKIVGAQLINLTRAMIDAYKVVPSVGVSTQAATLVCQRKGYTNYVPGSIVSTQSYDCGYNITRASSQNTFYLDNACYNLVLQSMQCWK